MSWYERALAGATGTPVPVQPAVPPAGIQVQRPYVAPTMPGQQPQQYAATPPPGSTTEYLQQGTPDMSKVQQQTGRCPNCGGPNLFEIPGASVMTKAGKVSAEKCTDCGYPAQQEFSKFGSGTLAAPDGNVHRARQLPADYTPAGVLPRFEIGEHIK